MKFISLKSRGGDYLVVARNVAWLQSDENGKTKVSIVGSKPLLVEGYIEDIVAQTVRLTEQVVPALCLRKGKMCYDAGRKRTYHPVLARVGD